VRDRLWRGYRPGGSGDCPIPRQEVSGGCPRPAGVAVSAVYRLRSTTSDRCFYTIDKAERDRLWRKPASPWQPETVAFYAFPQSRPGTCPVYRFHSRQSDSYYYTVDEAEKNEYAQSRSDAWTYEGVAFHAFAEKSREVLSPVYHLRSSKTGTHLYVAGELTKQKVLGIRSGEWTDAGIAWYAYEP
jgi:hypothetical protein